MAHNGRTSVETSTRRRVRVVISKDHLTATIVIRRPNPEESEITAEEVTSALTGAGVVYGIDSDTVAKALAEKAYDTPVKIAEGDPPRKGEDTKFEYCFEVNYHSSPKTDKDGRIDYRDLNAIQNVDKDAVLARRTHPTLGSNGKGVEGKEIFAPRGRNLPFKYGANTRVSKDGLELTATASGAVIFRNGTIVVKDVLDINGDVDFSVGNVDCNGSVRIYGDIQAGFKLNVGGNLEVAGNVHDCQIVCRGNLLIKGGCFGKGEGNIHADGDVVLKYAEGQKISSDRQVLVGGELLNCHVTAKECVCVRGKKGVIIGGEVNVGKEIRAAIIGSDAGTPTVLTVAYDAELMKEYQETLHETSRLEVDAERVKEKLVDLYNLQMSGKLSPDKETVLKQLEQFQKNVPNALEELRRKKQTLEERLKQYKDAAIIAEDTIFPGVVAHFGIINHRISEAKKQCKLTLEGNQVIFSEFRPDKT
jgi:uncharacterized protein (DUF342 family)